MERFVFKESTDKNVWKAILVAISILLVLIGLLIVSVFVFGIDDSIMFPFLLILLGFFFIALVFYFRKKVVFTSIYELGPEEISRTNTRTNEKNTFRLSDIEYIENDYFTYNNTEIEYIRIKFKNSRIYFTIQPDPNDIKSLNDFSHFKHQLYQFLKDQQWYPNTQPSRTGVYSSFLFWTSIVILFFLVFMTVMVIFTEKLYKIQGLIPIYIGFIPLIIIGLSRSKRKNK